MRLVNISERTITLDLDPEDCHRLALMCQTAAEHAVEVREQVEWMRTCEVMAMGLPAAAMAGSLTWGGGGDLAEVLAGLDPLPRTSTADAQRKEIEQEEARR